MLPRRVEDMLLYHDVVYDGGDAECRIQTKKQNKKDHAASTSSSRRQQQPEDGGAKVVVVLLGLTSMIQLPQQRSRRAEEVWH